MNVNKLDNNGPNNGVLLQSSATYFSPQWLAHLSNIFDIGSAYIQSVDCCLKWNEMGGDALRVLFHLVFSVQNAIIFNHEGLV